MTIENDARANDAGVTPVAAGRQNVAKPPYPKARLIRFDFADTRGDQDRHFINGDMALSHFVALLSASFPPGEEGFVRSVRRVSDQISDPILKKQVAGFIGQETVHGREHDRLNDRLDEMGYRVPGMAGFFERQVRLETHLSPRVHLAMTAAAEHYTAVLAEQLLSSDELQAIPGDPEVWNLLNWHAFEELEHKSVAFDVYRSVGGQEWMRITVMVALMVLSFVMTSIWLTLSLMKDPCARRHPIRAIRQVLNLFRGPVFKGIPRKLAVYLKPGFHPGDIDSSELLERWQTKLFGANGALVAHKR